MAGHDAGLQVTCPGCGETVLLKAMIPLLGEDGTGIRYLCVACARALNPMGASEANASDAPTPTATASPAPTESAEPSAAGDLDGAEGLAAPA